MIPNVSINLLIIVSPVALLTLIYIKPFTSSINRIAYLLSLQVCIASWRKVYIMARISPRPPARSLMV